MSDGLKRSIGHRVLAARTHAGLTQEQLAAEIGRSVEAVSNIERGLSLPTLETMDRIAKTVEMPFASFFADGVDEPFPNRDRFFQLGLIIRKLSSRDASLLIDLAKSMEAT